MGKGNVHENWIQKLPYRKHVICFAAMVPTAYSVLNALIQSISTLKSPAPDLAPGTPPSAFTDSDMPRIRDGFISKLASITFPLHVGR